MLQGIHPLLSPDLLHALSSMGHGDEIVVADANFPAATNATRLVRADGIPAVELVEAILTVLPLDTFVEHPVICMASVDNPDVVPEAVVDFKTALSNIGITDAKMKLEERHAFYERARRSFVVVATGETRPYGNISLKKGVVKLLIRP